MHLGIIITGSSKQLCIWRASRLGWQSWVGGLSTECGSVAGMLLPPSRAILPFTASMLLPGPHLACLPTAGGVTDACGTVWFLRSILSILAIRKKSSTVFYTSKVVFKAPSVISAIGKRLLCTRICQAQVVLQQDQEDMAFEEGGSLGVCIVLLCCLFKTFIIFWLFPLAGQARPVRQA